jgi:hypothetical protein
MRRRPKYKVGDILEYWQLDLRSIPYRKMINEHFLVTDVKMDLTLSKRIIWYYYVMPVSSILVNKCMEFRYERIDMLTRNRYSRLCIEGWRKVS